mmetsp:Transcript_7811/g.48436  ORF Transcript_7811/g.48436 Transcript_7811/m.48436 type:complete len:200 (-) Transcript_7811:146-745(-)|eukprot:CAMPEP_0113930602 /NCGR_PEP_ID=MMETSP1159-20121227/6042_1 /TAXON_ID=88271 /ORGANISM="Picocystis salinarum" /LENGTH=199 /DNA_ID=CAMNT_0000931405 /DNA_START=532 /DNA_END=1131 /DNA_ORIENTATION=+ /assembly_acc=CAM_ASM_000767
MLHSMEEDSGLYVWFKSLVFILRALEVKTPFILSSASLRNLSSMQTSPNTLAMSHFSALACVSGALPLGVTSPLATCVSPVIVDAGVSKPLSTPSLPSSCWNACSAGPPVFMCLSEEDIGVALLFRLNEVPYVTSGVCSEGTVSGDECTSSPPVVELHGFASFVLVSGSDTFGPVSILRILRSICSILSVMEEGPFPST